MSLLLLLNNSSSTPLTVTPTGLTASAFTNNSQHTTQTVSVTVTTENYLSIVCSWQHFATAPAISGVTVNGVAATAVAGTDGGSISRGTNNRSQSWEFVAPPAGTYNVVVTFASSTLDSNVVVQGFTGVNQSTPSRGGLNAGLIPAGAGAKIIAPTTTTASGNYLIGSYVNSGGGLADVTANDTQISEVYDTNNGTIFNTQGEAVTGAGASLSWSDTTFFDGAGHVYEIVAGTGSGGNTTTASGAPAAYTYNPNPATASIVSRADPSAFLDTKFPATARINVFGAPATYQYTPNIATAQLRTFADVVAYSITALNGLGTINRAGTVVNSSGNPASYLLSALAATATLTSVGNFSQYNLTPANGQGTVTIGTLVFTSAGDIAEYFYSAPDAVTIVRIDPNNITLTVVTTILEDVRTRTIPVDERTLLVVPKESISGIEDSIVVKIDADTRTFKITK